MFDRAYDNSLNAILHWNTIIVLHLERKFTGVGEVLLYLFCWETFVVSKWEMLLILTDMEKATPNAVSKSQRIITKYLSEKIILVTAVKLFWKIQVNSWYLWYLDLFVLTAFRSCV